MKRDLALVACSAASFCAVSARVASSMRLFSSCVPACRREAMSLKPSLKVRNSPPPDGERGVTRLPWPSSTIAPAKRRIGWITLLPIASASTPATTSPASPRPSPISNSCRCAACAEARDIATVISPIFDGAAVTLSCSGNSAAGMRVSMTACVNCTDSPGAT